MASANTESWLDFLSMETLTSSFGSPAVLTALGHNYRYAKPPQLVESDAVAAVMQDANVRDLGLWRGRRTSTFGVWQPRVSYRRDAQNIARLFTTCSCGMWSTQCGHVIAMLTDLTIDPTLRALARDERAAASRLFETAKLRGEAREELLASSFGEQWFQHLPTPNREGRWDMRLAVFDGRVSGASAYEAYTLPTLELRLQEHPVGGLFDPRMLRVRRLPPLERRVFTLGQPLSRSRKGVALEAVPASMALQLLHASRRTVLLGEKGSEPVRFDDAPVSVRVVRTKLPRGLLSVRISGADVTDANVALEEVPALEGRWTTEDGALDVSARETAFFSGPYPYLWVPSRRAFHPVAPSVDVDVAWNLHQRPTAELPARQAAKVYRGLQRTLGGHAVGLPPPEEMGLAPRATLDATVRIDGKPLDVVAKVEARYDFGTLALGPEGPLTEVPFEQDVRRDGERERMAVARVEAAGLRWDPELRAFTVVEREAVDFWTKGLASLRDAHTVPLTLLVAENLKGVVVRPPVKARVRVSLVGNLLDTEVNFDVGELAADIELVREALRNKRRWVALDDGSVAEIQDALAVFVDELSEVLPDKADKRAKGQKGARVKLAAHQLGRVERWIDAGIGGEVDPAVEVFRSRLKALAVKGDAELAKGLRAELRSYQKQGVAWLQFLDGLGTGGVLADDMGLGKTLMTLALLLWRKERDGAAPTLVVCPTSVAGNWVREAARFTPGLKVLLYHGIAREKDAAALASVDIVVTTYALLRRDVTLLAGVNFRYAILDEAQNIKNAGAQCAQAARELVADRRLALTGTPVENHLGELWSIMDFCNPGMLGSPRDFSARYERGISIDPKGPEAVRLRAMVRPFLLRRTKRDVLQDLPPKQEIDQVCAPGARQRRLYDALAATVLADVEKRIAEVGVARSGISILTALLRLRQMACDPRLVDASLPASASAKREAFLELVKAITGEDRRALVFSQFVELLTLWREDLDALGIAYEYLDGSTRDREAAVTRFQTGRAPLFLISLKAGGTGLNLTAADTVIHCDPWWNPAVEDQATDRAHRIGQTRAVTVYRLVAKGTVEEKIMALKGRKKELAEAVIAEDAGALRGLSADDVRTLLGGAEGGDDFEDDVEDAAVVVAKKPRAKKPR